jgi:hypothetical protein
MTEDALEPVETSHATLSWLGPNEISVRFASGTVVDRVAIAEVILARKGMQGDREVGLLLIVPADTELDMAIIGTDHLKVNKATDNVLGLAVVARNTVSEVLLRLYKAYYPTTFEARVFTDEEEAQAWLRDRVARALETSKS